MQILNSRFNLEEFFKELKVHESILMLDFDGTLAPFTLDPKRALPYPGVLEKLAKIMRCPGTRLIIITGRAIGDLFPLLDLASLPEIWGSHGAERWTPLDKKYTLRSFPPEVKKGLDLAKVKAQEQAPFCYLEVKPVSIALHWRGLDRKAKEEVRDKMVKSWQDIADHHSLEIHPFDEGMEIRPLGQNKGEAIKTLLIEASSDALIAFLGDDLTDEEAFTALDDRGLKVLVRRELRPTQADLQISPPDELLNFLEQWEHCQRKD